MHVNALLEFNWKLKIIHYTTINETL
jgi:hypothetical protein